MGKVTEWINREYNAVTETTSRAVVLNAALPVQLVSNNPNRFAVSFINLGGAVAFVGFDALTGALNGIYVAANGGWVGLNARDDQELPMRQFYAIGAGATTVFVTETVAVR